MNKIICRILGGLGNQLFCYAAARRLAIVNNAELVLDDVSGVVRDHDFQRHYQLDHFSIPCRKATRAERLEPLSRVRRYTIRSINYYRKFEDRKYIQQEGIDFDERLLAINPLGTIYLEGYWQSEQYFKDVEPVIRAELRIISPKDETNQAMAAHIRSCLAVAVHVRFFDVPQGGQEGGNILNDYYARAVANMEMLTPDAHYFVFSDQPDYARARLALPAERMTVVAQNLGDQNAYADLWLMTQCRHFIIANSTFSWWGAWLSTFESKIVIAPNPKLMGQDSYWRTVGILPEKWLLL